MQSAPSGLTRQQAQRRLSEFGPNIVEKVAPAFAREFVIFFPIILWFAAGLARLAGWREPTRHGAKGIGDPRGNVINRLFPSYRNIVPSAVYTLWRASCRRPPSSGEMMRRGKRHLLAETGTWSR